MGAERHPLPDPITPYRVFDDMLEGCQLISPDFRYLYVNQAVADHARRTVAELTGCRMVEVFPGIETTRVFAAIEACLETSQPKQMFNEFIFADGSVGYFELRINRVPEGVFVLSLDVTERKTAEEEREKLQKQLAQAQKMESVGRLAGGIAHDFNNMLGVILGRAELAMADLDPSDQLYHELTEIRKAAQRSAGITRQLLAFARKQAVAPKIIDMNETVASMLDMLGRLIGEDLELVWLPGKTIGPVMVDPAQIDQVLANLCVNARDAMGTGPGRVIIETATAHLDEIYCAEHSECNPGDYVVLMVSDTGVGIEKDDLCKIFEPFFTTKGMDKGTGLGLAMIYGIAKQNGGTVNVYSEPGIGTTFKIYFPLQSGDIQTDEGETTRPPRVIRGLETILLVEDEPAILHVTAQMLRSQGYTVLSAATPGEALRQAQEHDGEIQLLMTDVVMPEMNGRDLARELKAFYPEVKCLYMSGYTDNVIAHHGVLEAGIHFIPKPFSMKEMAAMIKSTWEA